MNLLLSDEEEVPEVLCANFYQTIHHDLLNALSERDLSSLPAKWEERFHLSKRLRREEVSLSVSELPAEVRECISTFGVRPLADWSSEDEDEADNHYCVSGLLRVSGFGLPGNDEIGIRNKKKRPKPAELAKAPTTQVECSEEQLRELAAKFKETWPPDFFPQGYEAMILYHPRAIWEKYSLNRTKGKEGVDKRGNKDVARKALVTRRKDDPPWRLKNLLPSDRRPPQQEAP